jgi:hypothetical protein
MRSLILAVVLGAAAPAFGAEDTVPVADAAALGAAAGEVAPESEAARGEAAAAAEPEPAEPASAPAPLSADAVARATFATAIEAREPVDSISSLESDRSRVYYFTELVGVSGREVTHRWEYQGEVVAEVPIAIGGPRWRAYSSKGLDVSQLGEWTVSVIDESGSVLRKESFVYEEAAPTQEVAVPEPVPGTAPTATPPAKAAAPAFDESTDEVPASPAPTQP